MGELDAAGELVTGALIGRVVEPERGEGRDGHGLCLNCGTALIGAHCHRCGQSAHVHRTFGAIWHEILHGVVHFEGKLWRTLPLLAFRPGELTRRYIRGERARFVSPMALFLFSIFTMFAVLSILGVSPPAKIGTPQQVEAGMERAIADTRAKRDDVVAQRDALAPGDPDRQRLDREIAAYAQSLNALEQAEPMVIEHGFHTDFHTGWASLDHGIEKWNANPSLMLYKLQANSYKFSWLLIPLSLPFVWLMFAWKREYHGYDHAVFVTYSIAFMSLFFIVLTVAGALGLHQDVIELAMIIVPPVHIYRQLRGAYRLRWWSALLRTALLLVLIWVILILFLVVLLGLGLLG